MTGLSDPTVSVVIATHGRARLLAETLDALDAQDGPSFEVVVVDDESPDDTSASTIRASGPGGGVEA